MNDRINNLCAKIASPLERDYMDPMVDYIGIISAIIVLVAALFGLIPPILSTSASGGKSDHATSELIGGLRPILLAIGGLAVFFFYMFGMMGLTDFMSSSNKKDEPAIELHNVSEEELNLIVNAELLSQYRDRDEALLKIIDFALTEGKQGLAILAASKLSQYRDRDEQLERILTQFVPAPEPSPAAPSKSQTPEQTE